MRRVLTAIGILALLQSATAAPPPANAPWPEAAQRWIKTYRTKPEPMAVAAVIKGLSQRGALKEPESAGLYAGFFAGVLGANPKHAWAIVEKTLPLPFEDQWIVVRALAYSGLPSWKDHMRGLAMRLPERQVMVERYLTGDLPPLSEVKLEPEKPGTFDKVKRFFNGDMFFAKDEPPKRQVTFASNAELIDTLWGIYFATGKEAPIARIVELLPWARERDSVEKLTIGSMARFTLASNAARDVDLLRVLKRMKDSLPDEKDGEKNAVKLVLTEVVEAAELSDTARFGKDALAALDDLKRKGPGSTRDLLTWGSVGQAAVSMGCLGLAVAGQVEAGIPCVLGGALGSGALRYIGGSSN
ncbi:MAG: hypothetical protein WAN43_02955 [Rhodomicrobium sp.]|jgi:hypothetical protein